MKAFVCSLALLAGFAISARADFTIVQKIEGKGQAHEMTLKIKGDKIRLEATPQITMIVDGRTGDTITLMNAQKKIVRISGDRAKAIGEMAAKYGGMTAEKPKLVATGKKMTVNGYEAEEYVADGKRDGRAAPRLGRGRILRRDAVRTERLISGHFESP